MATSKVQVTEGSGKNISSYSFTEDSVTKEAQRVALNNSSGTEIGTASNPIRTDPTASTTQPVSIADTVTVSATDLDIRNLTATDVVTANLSAVDNAVLDDIAAKLATIDADTSTLAAGVSTEYQVDIVGSLPAGTAAIGKLATNSGVDIGDVDVTSIANGSLNGPGAPVIDSYTHAAINLSAGANQSLVAAPGASKQIWVYGIVGVLSVAGTVSIQDEDDTAITGIMPFAANSGPGIPPSGNFAMPIWKVATNKALEMDLVTADFDGWLDYGVVSV